MVITNGTVGTIGLSLDIIGAYFLAQGFIKKTIIETWTETRDLVDGNPLKMRGALHQMVEARVGFVLLFLGFIGQLLAYSGTFDLGKSTLGGPWILVGVFVWYFIYRLTQDMSVSISRQVLSGELWDVIEALAENVRVNPNSNRGTVYMYALALDLEEADDESLLELSVRLRDLARESKEGYFGKHLMKKAHARDEGRV